MISYGESVRPLLLKALSLLQEKGNNATHAIDFGVGGGDETALLLQHGYKVTAIDNVKEFLTDITLQTRNQPFLKNLTIVESNFETVPWQAISPVDLFVSFYSLNFILPESFDSIWEKICAHINKDGYFVGTVHTHHYRTLQHDGYFLEEPILVPFRNKETLRNLFKEFSLEYFENEKLLYPNTDQDRVETAYSVIARKLH